ncbi:Git3 domain-containing protein [Mycena indigotica]|uniref:Git3 domain-containing protein n=1 Tax=Mycena indigotica TaxID=2126181 RepID=A0A8H6WHN0_9AGAR|nr:Git3 domain-containing protein [Mycena indigotica]KAF7315258.1 Git3 domain-containing protein [Mycena indigotica]
MSTTALLPDGTEWLLRNVYTPREVHGVTVLVVISCISLVFVVGLLGAIALSAFNTRSSLDQHLFVRTHVAAYFVSLLVSDLFQALGSILNARWIRDMAVELGPLCTAQGVLKQLADVATAWWTLVIAIHTFCLLFLELKTSRFTLYATLISGWFGIAAIVIAGPAALDTVHHGPFYGISGYWCWISPGWPGARIGLDYLFMFMAAFFSFILYMLIFLRMRGNIIVEGRRVSFRLKKIDQWRGKRFENQALTIARQMLLYPIAYTILILPIAASRFSSFSGDDVPFGVTVFSAAVFLLSGIVNVTLFCATRRILPPESFKIPKWKISAPKEIPALEFNPGQDSYYQNSGTYASSMDEKEKLPSESFDSVPPALNIRTTNVGVPHIQAPPAGHHREDRVESVYNMYAEPTSAIPLTPTDESVNRLA